MTEQHPSGGGVQTHLVRLDGTVVGCCWPTRDGGLALRTGESLVRPRVHYFSPSEGVDGLKAYLRKRFQHEPSFSPELP